VDKLNLQAQYLAHASLRSDGTLHQRKLAQDLVPSRAHPAPSNLKVAQSGPAVNLEIKHDSPNPVDVIPMSADRRINAYQRNTKLL
jgi:hypothetical protein